MPTSTLITPKIQNSNVSVWILESMGMLCSLIFKKTHQFSKWNSAMNFCFRLFFWCHANSIVPRRLVDEDLQEVGGGLHSRGLRGQLNRHRHLSWSVCFFLQNGLFVTALFGWRKCVCEINEHRVLCSNISRDREAISAVFAYQFHLWNSQATVLKDESTIEMHLQARYSVIFDQNLPQTFCRFSWNDLHEMSRHWRKPIYRIY